MTADLLLQRALERSADAAAVTMIVRRAAMTRWASATFAGARHEVELEIVASASADDWLTGLPEAELPLRDHLVADLKLVAVTRDPRGIAVTLEVLTVEER